MDGWMQGAVSVRLRCGETSLCFVCSHLNSGGQLADRRRRNADVDRILRRTRFRRRRRRRPDAALVWNRSHDDDDDTCRHRRDLMPRTILGHE
jgi:hypothetical protein